MMMAGTLLQFTRRVALLGAAALIGCGGAETHSGAADGVAADTVVPGESPVQQPAPQVEIEPAATDTPAATPGGAGAVEPGLRGTVIVSGTATDPFTTLQLPDGPPVRVTGPLEPELRSLSGAVVLVRGPRTTGSPGSVRADSYQILEVGGRRPWTGTVLPDGRLAAGADTLHLSGGAADIRPGMRVWITGERSGDELRVASWGAIRR